MPAWNPAERLPVARPENPPESRLAGFFWQLDPLAFAPYIRTMSEAYTLPAIVFTSLAAAVASGSTVMTGLFVLALLLTALDLLLTLFRG